MKCHTRNECKDNIAKGNVEGDGSFLDEALRERESLPGPLCCTEEQVKDVKIVIKTLPIFMSTIMLNCCLAQLSTFSIQQASTMNTKLGSLTVPPAALPVFPVVFTMILALMYNHLLLPLARKNNQNRNRLHPSPTHWNRTRPLCSRNGGCSLGRNETLTMPLMFLEVLMAHLLVMLMLINLLDTQKRRL